MTSIRPTTEQEQQYYLSAYLDFAPEIFENVVDSTLDKAIVTIIDKQKERVIKAKGIIIDDPYEDALNAYYDYQFKLVDQDIIFALYELKIIYLYKHFEIKLKELSSICFEDWPDKEVYIWEKITEFYISKDINLKVFYNYKSVFELGRVNNSLKHSGKNIGKKIKNISEFSKAEILEYKHLEAFYLRVKEAPKAFIIELASVINNKLFPRVKSDFELEFDESTIEFDGELPFWLINAVQ